MDSFFVVYISKLSTKYDLQSMSIIDILVPRYCLVCDCVLYAQHERFICIQCYSNLPLSCMGYNSNNLLAKALWGRIPECNCGSLLTYKSSSQYSSLIKEFKYNNNKGAGYFLALQFGLELRRFSLVDFKNVGAIVPIPLSKTKKLYRGYNQSEILANGISKILKIPVRTDILFRGKNKDSQTKKGRFDRWLNLQNIYYIDKDKLEGLEEIVLIDDIITTGSTMVACIETIQKKKNIKINVLSIAYTHS